MQLDSLEPFEKALLKIQLHASTIIKLICIYLENNSLLS